MSNTISMRETAQGVGEKAPLKHEHIKKDITDLMNPRYFEKVCIYYGYPNAINESWNIDASVGVYKNYDIVVFGDEYYEPTHEAYADMIKIITELKKAKPAVKIFGYVPCAVKEGTKNHTTEVIKTIITKWNACGVTGVFLDEFGYDYWNTRERQNEIVSHARTFGMPVFVNSWEDKYVFSNEAITIDWMPDFAPNPTKIASIIGKDDYSLYENMFWDAHSGTQKTQESWVVYKAYDYYNENQSEFGMTYHKKYGTKTVSLDGILKAKELTAEGIMMRTISLYLARILNIDGIAFGDQNWGSSGHFNVWQLPDVPLDREGLSGVSVKYATAGHPNEFSATINGKSIVVKWDCKTQSLTAGTRELYIDGVLNTNAWFTLEDKVAELKVEVADKAPMDHTHQEFYTKEEIDLLLDEIRNSGGAATFKSLNITLDGTQTSIELGALIQSCDKIMLNGTDITSNFSGNYLDSSFGAGTIEIFNAKLIRSSDSFTNTSSIKSMTNIEGIIDGSANTGMASMFSSYRGESLNLVMETPNCTNLSQVFWKSAIINVDFSIFKGAKPTTLLGALRSTTRLESVNWGELDYSNLTNLTRLFASSSIKNVNLSGLNTSKVTTMESAFEYLNSDIVDLSSCDLSSLTSMKNAFSSAKISLIKFGKSNLDKLTDTTTMFNYSIIGVIDMSDPAITLASVTKVAQAYQSKSDIRSTSIRVSDSSKTTGLNLSKVTFIY